MRELYISKVCPKPPCLIAKMKLGVSVQCKTIYQIPHAGGQLTLEAKIPENTTIVPTPIYEDFLGIFPRKSPSSRLSPSPPHPRLCTTDEPGRKD